MEAIDVILDVLRIIFIFYVVCWGLFLIIFLFSFRKNKKNDIQNKIT